MKTLFLALIVAALLFSAACSKPAQPAPSTAVRVNVQKPKPPEEENYEEWRKNFWAETARKSRAEAVERIKKCWQEVLKPVPADDLCGLYYRLKLTFAISGKLREKTWDYDISRPQTPLPRITPRETGVDLAGLLKIKGKTTAAFVRLLARIINGEWVWIRQPGDDPQGCHACEGAYFQPNDSLDVIEDLEDSLPLAVPALTLEDLGLEKSRLRDLKITWLRQQEVPKWRRGQDSDWAHDPLSRLHGAIYGDRCGPSFASAEELGLTEVEAKRIRDGKGPLPLGQ